MKMLDVGCGYRPHPEATHTVDIYLYTPEIIYNGTPCNVDRSRNFILASAEYLPFQDSVFEEVYCSHVIEHTINHNQAIKELERVVNGKVTIKVPHRYNPGQHKHKYHRHHFNLASFNRSGYDIQLKYIMKRFKFLPFIGIPLVFEIVATKQIQRLASTPSVANVLIVE